MGKPRLTVVLPTLNGGGAEKVLVSTAGFLRNDWEITFILTDTSRNDDTYAAKLAELGVPVVRLPAFRRLETARKLRPIRRAVLGTEPDVVLSAITGSNAIVSLALRGTGIPHVMSERKDLRRIFATALPRPRLYRLLTWLSYRAPNSKASIVVSDAIRERVLEDFSPRTPLVSIHNGLDVLRLRREAELLPDGALPEGGVPSIAFVGRLTPDKNVPLLMKPAAGRASCSSGRARRRNACGTWRRSSASPGASIFSGSGATRTHGSRERPFSRCLPTRKVFPMRSPRRC